ncbi:MAG: EamA/RhaT family transporter [Acidobacteria bacterium]|nr:MAG: EamA/RhaT family transporter [Acidobacteriota bacterium]REK07947.1 MAG: EamA/RhaT family transporter [Acidobacteriota bacterium]
MSSTIPEPAAVTARTTGAAATMVVVALLFSTGGAAVKATDLGAWEVACGRSLIAALVIAALDPSTVRRVARAGLAIGLAYAATLTLFVHANKLTTASHAVFLQATAPFYVFALAPWLLGERWNPSQRRAAVLFAAALLCLVLGTSAPSATASAPALGGALAAASAITYALLVIGLRAAERDRPGRTTAAGMQGVLWGNLFAVAICLLPAVRSLRGAAVGVGASDLLVVVYLGALQVGLAYWLMVRAVRFLAAAQVSLLLLLEPLASPLWAYLLHAERPTAWTLAGGALALAATAAGLRSRRIAPISTTPVG